MPLNIKQSEAADAVLTGHNVLLLGAAGTGKTYLIKEIVQRLKYLNKSVAVTATTGIACCLYENASTIHRWSGIGDGRHDVSHIQTVIENNVQFAEARKRVLKTDVLIIDECSMLSKRFFDSLNEVCKIKNKSLLFGGIQLLISGDFRQLPPVPNPLYGEEGEFCFQSCLFEKVFPHTITLTEVIRQTENDLVQAIHEVSLGDVSHDTLLYIESLKRPLPNDAYSDCIKLFSRNDQVDDFNRKSIVEFPGQIYEFKSDDEGEQKCLNKMLVPDTLWLKIGAHVILLRNLSDKLVNGLRGNIYDITDSGPIVEFPSLNLKMPLERVRFSVFSPTRNTEIAVRMQYPVKLSYAISIHKSQGLTIDCLEVDCRHIFKPGQLGVALGRARSSKGLRVINFKPHLCVIQQPEVVRDFLTRDSTEFLEDKTCCRPKLESSEQKLTDTVTEEELLATEPEKPIDLYEDQPDDEDFDNEFDEIISMITVSQSEPVTLPTDLDLDIILCNLKCENVKTTMQENTNQILKDIDHGKYSQFCQSEYLKMSSFIEDLNIDASVPVSAKNQCEFYSKVHSYQTSAEFRMSCLTFFENSKFTEDHLPICFNISNDIRKYLLKKKTELFPIGQRKISHRTLSNASNARVRYVGGYCIAKVRDKYRRKKKSNMYKTDAASQALYEESGLAVDILDCLKVEEQYIISTTNEPESLLDVSRRQRTHRSLTNIDDNLFHFFQQLTEICLSLLIDENLNKYGENLFTHIRSEIIEKQELYESFCEVVGQNINKDPEEVEKPLSEEIQKEHICNIYQKIIKLFLTVMVNQFRKDVLESFNIQKKMAHRKQVRVSQSGQYKSKVGKSKAKKDQAEELSQKPGTSKDNVTSAKKRKKKSVAVAVESGSASSQEMEDIQRKSKRKIRKTITNESSSCEDDEENEGQPQKEKRKNIEEKVDENVAQTEENESIGSDGSDEEKCKVCNTSEKYFKGEILWIQCDGCNSWFHRTCAGLQHHMKWKKATRKGSKFYCSDCK